ncbi:MAG: hypothetical protein IJY92_01940 [Alphaproteobacteria bacterium]|nr:hypothetical protein [Alphaproteobacteria bacterium]
MAETEQKNPSYQETFGGEPKSHDELVAPFEDIKEEDFFEKDLDAPEEEKDYNEEDLPEREYIPMPSIFDPIPEEAQKEILSKFALKKREKEEVIATTAQRLVNQFRALSAFRDDYVVTYNKELMQMSDDVINYLPTIIGGPAVREYLDYLLAQRKQGKEYDNENIDFSIMKNEGYLPSPDEDFDYSAPQGSGSTSTDPSVIKNQTTALVNAIQQMQKANEDQAKTLNETILLLKETLEKTPTPVTVEGAVSAPVNTADTMALLDNQRQMMETALEKMVQMQSSLFSKTVEELSKTVQEVQSQLKPVGVVRQAMSSLKASSQKKGDTPSKQEKAEKPEKQEKAPQAEKDALPLLKEVVKEASPKEETQELDLLTPSVEAPQKEKSRKKRTYESEPINEEEYEILTEFDIQED